ncbi:MAG: hypothetical protein ACNA8K_06090 [Cyclonatronaceae bacterium]
MKLYPHPVIRSVFQGLLLSMVFVMMAAPVSRAQLTGEVIDRYTSITQNSISNMGALGDTLWTGPLLFYTLEGTVNFFAPEGADSVLEGRGRLFSISVSPDTVIAGLGYNDDATGESVQTGLGFHTTTDGGLTWDFIPLPLDDPEATSILYGGRFVESVPVIVPQQSPPFDVTHAGNTVFYAGWASGIRRSLDFGETWERILLPPTTLRELRPNRSYDFVFDPRLDNNFLGFSVLVDRDGYVWAGTAAGLNISANALTAPADSIGWLRHWAGTENNRMLGNWVIKMRENPKDGRIWMTNWIAAQGEQQGVVSTADKGNTFTRYLEGERIYDIAFYDDTIYASGDNGLFISRNNGQTWEQISQIRSPNALIKRTANYLSLAHTTERLWVGTTDGLASTNDQGRTWHITRVEYPLKGGNQLVPEGRNVNAYAYPNPFSPSIHDIVRLRFEAPASGLATVRLFDFGMNLIRELETDFQVTTGRKYEVIWDGTDNSGRKAGNGAVFYRISVGNDHTTGKILVLE